MNKKITAFYIDVMNCSFSKKECPQALKSISAGLVPRAFSPCHSTTADILVVAKNPGHPLSGEPSYFRGKRGKALLKAKEEWDSERSKRMQTTNDNSLKYHRNLRRYLRYFLGISKSLETYDEYQVKYNNNHEKEISRRVAFTNLFKCSTKCEQAKIKRSSFAVCYKKYFVREMELIQPKAILTLGSEVSHFLQAYQLEVPIVSIKHPSYFYQRKDEANILREKKFELQEILNPQQVNRGYRL
jgi:uracil-DNA glycosylase